MSHDGAGSASLLFISGAVALVVLTAWRGWRLGIVRQALSMVSLAAGYLAGWLFGGVLIPLLRPLGFPDRILSIFGAVLIGFAVYVGLSIVAGLLFKRTSHQSVGVVRFGFGAAGALLGAAFGVFLVFVCIVAIRLIGTVADAEIHSKHTAPPSGISARMAALKKVLHEGSTGAIIDRVDPVPEKVYDTLGKLGQLASSPEGLDRFASDRSVQHASAHPKILALRDDPAVARAIREGDFLALLRHPKVIEAANDPAVMKLLGEFDLQKALDGALKTKPTRPPNVAH